MKSVKTAFQLRLTQSCVAATSTCMALPRYCFDVLQDKEHIILSCFPAICIKRPTNVLVSTNVLLFTDSNRKVFDMINLFHGLSK